MRSKTILLVEDNPDDEALTIRALSKSGVASEITVVHDGAEALEYLFATGSYRDREKTDLPRIIVLDLKLPKIDGLEVLRQLRDDEGTKLVPVVVLTSSIEERDLAEAYRLGANSYVRKPVDFVEFSDAVRQLGEYWLRVNEPPPRS